jgi:DNA-binding response OmpR family regulator
VLLPTQQSLHAFSSQNDPHLQLEFMQNHAMRLIFVEDDAAIREVVVECLQEQGYDVVQAATAEDAMRHMARAPAPQLVVTDIDLGAGRSGLEFADWLHERWPELNVIFATGRLDRLEGRVLDPREACLAKPFRFSKLIELVRSFARSPAAAKELEASGSAVSMLACGSETP